MKNSPQAKVKVYWIFLAMVSLAIITIIFCTLIITQSDGLFVTSKEEVYIESILNPESFPTKEISYPENWPIHSSFTSDFILVSTSSGTLPIDNTSAWVTKLRYEGKPSYAVDMITQHYQEQGWNIRQKISITGSGMMLIIQKKGTGMGIIVIETNANNPKQILSTITIYQ